MWLVNIGDKKSAGYNRWHFAAGPDAVELACGIANPPWYRRWETDRWYQSEHVRGVAVAKRIEGAVLGELEHIKADHQCSRCFQELSEELKRRRRAALVSERLKEGRLEVTLDGIVTVVDRTEEEELRCAFDGTLAIAEQAEFCSPESPMGRALLGRFTGDEVEVIAPGGVLCYVVVSVQRGGTDQTPMTCPDA